MTKASCAAMRATHRLVDLLPPRGRVRGSAFCLNLGARVITAFIGASYPLLLAPEKVRCLNR